MSIISNFPEKKGLNADDINDIASGEISNGFVQNPFCYSTSEQVVGRQINGKPIYQISISGTITTANTSTIIATNLFTTYNIDEIVGIEGILTDYNGNGGKGALPCTYAYYNGSGDMHTGYIGNDGNFYSCGRYRGKVVYHIRYTKTTD